jgi:hypothetical protein
MSIGIAVFLMGTLLSPAAEGTAKLVLLSPPADVEMCLRDASAEKITFAWRGAAGPYKLQIASDREFKHMVREENGLTDNSIEVRGLGAGRYAWRVGTGKKPTFSALSWLEIVDNCTTP